MVPLRCVAALVIVVDSADAVAHRLRRHVSTRRDGNVDVITDAKTGEVGASSAVPKPCVNVGAPDLVCEDRSERAPSIRVCVVLSVVFLGSRYGVRRVACRRILQIVGGSADRELRQVGHCFSPSLVERRRLAAHGRLSDGYGLARKCGASVGGHVRRFAKDYVAVL